jgi:sialidase-1
MNRNIVLIIAWIGLGCFVASGAPGEALAELRVLSQTDVFVNGTYDGVKCDYRIPSIVTTPDGTLIAFIEEGRGPNGTGGDAGDGNCDVVYKRSFDNGVTWTEKAVLADPGGPGSDMAGSNPTPVVDRDTGKVWVFYNIWEAWYGTVKSKPGTDNCQAWARWSDDNGTTWSDPIDLTRQARDYDKWGAMYFGPGGAIQAAGGRLIIPACRKKENGGGGSDYTPQSYAFYSDDHGATWNRGEMMGTINLTNENQLVELANGNIMMDARQVSGKHRWTAISTDGGKTWGKPMAGQRVCSIATAIERCTLKSGGKDCHRFVWTAPSGNWRNLEVRVSRNASQTFPEVKRLYTGTMAYSDLTVLADGTIGVIFERDEYTRMTFIRFRVTP